MSASGLPHHFPEVWTRHDLPGLPWCIAKGTAKAILLVFFTVLLPLEIFYTLFAASGLPLTRPWSADLLIYGGGALALTSGAFTATQTTRLYGFFHALNRAVKVAYLYVLATLALITLGPLTEGGGAGAARVVAHVSFVDLFLLFMIPPAIATLAWTLLLVEDAKHPGQRLPWDFPLSRKERRRRERMLAEAWGIPPPWH